jgi:hypothetical protein
MLNCVGGCLLWTVEVSNVVSGPTGYARLVAAIVLGQPESANSCGAVHEH